MAKATRQFVCQQCGHVMAKWMGRCPECDEWESIVEETRPGADPRRDAGSGLASPARAVRLGDVSLDDSERLVTGIRELDQVLGGGLVPGSVILLAGEPGIGKSTLALQFGVQLLAQGKSVLYISAEESVSQLRLRSERLELTANELLTLSEIDLDMALQAAAQLAPDVLVIDSIQAVYDPGLESAPSTLSQVRQTANRIAQFAKRTGTVAVLIGHVTKEGSIAGPKTLEHLVDVVLYFEGERTSSYRMLRGMKNRFGSTEELGLFEMTERGMIEVTNASALFLANRAKAVSGSIVTCTMEGTRPLLVELQALTSSSWAGSARRLLAGIDYGRGSLMIAVLEKRVGLSLVDQDVYVNVAGGLKVTEPASDLAVLLAIASSYRDVSVNGELIAVGEVGLAGEVRPIPKLGRRLTEAQKLGFKEALIPAASLNTALKSEFRSIKLRGVATAEEALQQAVSR